MKRVLEFIKKETVLSTALFLAVLSSFFVTPDKKYIDYVDFRTLAILFCLMTVVAGFSQQGIFDIVARKMINRMGNLRAITFVLVFICFFFSMFITNDVSLITFVPMTITVLCMAGEEILERWMVPVIALQTIAANLGSMLTPIGNPQNLYLYGLAGMKLGSFLVLMLPYTAASMIIIIAFIIIAYSGDNPHLEVKLESGGCDMNKRLVSLNCVLFVICILTVSRQIPYWITLGIVVIAVALFQRNLFFRVDYSLILTFVGFFVFIGNMGRIDWFNDLVRDILSGKEVVISVAASQVISNVPAAVLLSGFTDRIVDIIIGTNIGGLGTLIASMASLISFKYVARQNKGLRGRYMVYFTMANVVFLAVLMLLWFILR